MTSTTSAERPAFWGVSALLFAGSVAGTIGWCASMSAPAMAGMPMPGGWTMSMAWMRMPGQTWPGAAASFLGMWVVMMVAMMLPSLLPMLRRYRAAVGGAGAVTSRPADRRRGRSATSSSGRCSGWPPFRWASRWRRSRCSSRRWRVPSRSPAARCVLLAGLFQLTAWKARQLACCREAPGCGRTLPADVGTAWRHGLRLGARCSRCCAGLMAILLCIGVMDLRAMVVVAAAITVERLAPAGERVARGTGAVFVGAGLFLLARAAGLS